MAKDEVKLKVVELATPTGTVIKVRELQFKTMPGLFAKPWSLYPAGSSLPIMEPRYNADDLIYLNTRYYRFEIIKDDVGIACLRIIKRG